MNKESQKQESDLKSEIEEVLESKSDKSKIEFNQEILKSMVDLHESGESKDDIIFGVQELHGLMKPSLLEKYWKETGLGLSKCYRTETCLIFLEELRKQTELDPEFKGLVNPGKKFWSDRMIEGGFLKDTKNYLQHYSTYYSLFNRIPLDNKII